MLILVGSTRPAKVEGVREAIAAIASVDRRFREAELRPVDVTTVAPRMPMTEAAIVEGARVRAAAVLAREAEGGHLPPDREVFAVGVEGGLDPLPAGHGAGVRYALKTWACATDGRAWSYGAGPALVIPPWIAAGVEAGRELGDLIDELAGAPVRGTRGVWGVATRDLLGRRDAFRLAVVAAFARFFNPALYERDRRSGIE